MTLPVPNLDDRRFQDFVDDAKRHIQRRCPQWSDHNVSDPGVTLIETFAMVADQLVYRLNRVPPRLYLRFLELLGIELVSPAQARAAVTFWLSAPRNVTVVVPTATELASERIGPEQPVTFETVDELRILPCSLTQIATAVGDQVDVHTDTFLVPDGTPVTCFQDQPEVGDSLLVGLSNAIPSCVVTLRANCVAQGVGVDPRYPPLTWEAWTSQGWQPCEVEPDGDHFDGTGGFNRPGDIVMHVPAQHVEAAIEGREAGWLRCTLVESAGWPTYQKPPRLLSMEAFTVGGTVHADHAETVTGEVLGTSEGVAGQRFRVARGPVLGGRDDEFLVEVAGGQGPQRWERVQHFDQSGPTDQHFRFDANLGEVVFGPAVRQPDGSLRQFGAVPQRGDLIRAQHYRIGGGAHGNAGPGKICVMRTSVPFVQRVANRRAATGGVDGEDLEAAKLRAPTYLRTRQRAVTTADYEYLACEADPRVARARCVAGEEAGEIRMRVIPAIPGSVSAPPTAERFRPDTELLARVARYLDERRMLGTRLNVLAPVYRRIAAEARVRLDARTDVERIRHSASVIFYTYLHPLKGGPERTGWPFGRTVVAGELLARIAQLDGVDGVDEVRLFEFDLKTGVRLDGWKTRVDLGAEAVPFAVDLRLEVVR